MKNLLSIVLLVAFAAFTGAYLTAAQKREARVTQIIKDVRVLAANSSRAASVNETVVEGSAVRTGGSSRAELTFVDQTLTRLGENSVFTFGQGANQFDLASGAILLAAPKDAGTVHVRIGAATAAISGFTALIEKSNVNKLIMVEGRGLVSFSGFDRPCEIHDAQMMVWHQRPNQCPEVQTIDVGKLVKTSKLVNGFEKGLPPWVINEINVIVDNQNNGGTPPTQGPSDPTGGGAIQTRNNSIPSPSIIQPPSSPPGKSFHK